MSSDDQIVQQPGSSVSADHGGRGGEGSQRSDTRGGGRQHRNRRRNQRRSNKGGAGQHGHGGAPHGGGDRGGGDRGGSAAGGRDGDGGQQQGSRGEHRNPNRRGYSGQSGSKAGQHGQHGQRQGGGGQGGGQHGFNHKGPGGNKKSKWKKKSKGPGGGHGPRPQIQVAAGPPVETGGIIDVQKDSRGYLRLQEHDYSAREDDVLVPANLVRKHGLLSGSYVRGRALQPAPGQNKVPPTMVEVDSVDGFEPGAPELRQRMPFKTLTSLDPVEKFDLSRNTKDPTLRLLDLLTPIGKGQRGLIVAPPRTGKTILLQKIANAIADNHPEVHLISLLVDERPEEATDWRRNVRGEVLASTNDEMASNHVSIAEVAAERAKRLVEMKKDVVILFDSLTRLARAYNIETKNSGRTLTGGVDARTMEKPKSFFGSARNVEEGGSLTILATALVDTGSRMDQVIFEEFKGTGNMELVLSRKLADLRIFPAIDINMSGTRKEEKLLAPDSLRSAMALRRVLSKVDPIEGMQILIRKIQETESNAQFFSLFRGE